ncbi:Uncharacterised protein g11052 [Pycnogonum litorale]
MIRECYYGDDVCTQRDFFHRLSAEFGNCFTFGSIWKGDQNAFYVDEGNVRTQHDVGPNQGLALMFRANILDYIPGISEESGMRIVVHDPTSIPNIWSSGFDISPGKSTIIRVKQEVILRLPYHCVNDWSEVKKVSCSTCNPKQRYTQEECLQYRKQKLFVEECNCRSIQVMDFETYDLVEECEEYKQKNPETAECMLRIERNDSNDDCKPACKETQYPYFVSSTDWPTPTFAERIIEKYMLSTDAEELPEMGVNWTSDKIFSSDFGKVSIYVDTTRVQTITEIEKYTIITLVSNIGGLAGLYIGISFLSIYEMLEELCLRVKSRATENGEENNTNATENNTNQKQRMDPKERGAFQIQNRDLMTQSYFYVPFSSGSALIREKKPNY